MRRRTHVYAHIDTQHTGVYYIYNIYSGGGGGAGWGEYGYQWDGNGWRDDIYIFRGALGDASMDTSSYQWDGKGWQDVKEIIYHVCKDTARWCKSIFVACIIISSIFACQILPLLNGI